MGSLKELDDVLGELAGLLYRTAPRPDWERQTLDVHHAADGVRGHEYRYELSDGEVDEGVSPDAKARVAIRDLTLRHWTLSAGADGGSWSRMIVSVERTGEFGAEFEYGSDDPTGDVARRR